MAPTWTARMGILGLGCVLVVEAGAQREDLADQIKSQRATVADLERLDERRAAEAEIAQLRAWLSTASRRHSKGEIDLARELVVRCVAQAEMIRQLVQGAELRARVDAKDADVRDLERKIDRVRRALDEALEKKKALERDLKEMEERSEAPEAGP